MLRVMLGFDDPEILEGWLVPLMPFLVERRTVQGSQVEGTDRQTQSMTISFHPRTLEFGDDRILAPMSMH